MGFETYSIRIVFVILSSRAKLFLFRMVRTCMCMYVYVYVCVCVCVRAGVRVRVVVCVWLCMYVSQIVSRLARTCPIIRTYLSFPTSTIEMEFAALS